MQDLDLNRKIQNLDPKRFDWTSTANSTMEHLDLNRKIQNLDPKRFDRT